jgi:two-component system, LytTR family, response regulator
MTGPLRIFIVDDEPSCRNTLRSFLQDDFPEAIIAGEAGSIEKAVPLIKQTGPDLLLLDVHLEDGTGFDLLDCFSPPKFKVIFTTAHDEFALRAFRYSAIDYLLKPVDPDLFLEAVRRIETNLHPQEQQLALLKLNAASRQFDRIALNTGDGLIFIQTADILHLEANGNYTFAYLSDGEKHLVNCTMKDFEEMLPEPAFFRIHQSHLVNTGKVKKYLKDDGGYVVMPDGAKLPLARRRKEEFLRELGAIPHSP